MAQIENLNSRMIDDDSLLIVFSFIPPIPFFFTTLPLINKQLFQYFFNFVTTCPIEELNYFREINFWEFDCSLQEPQKKEHILVLKNHFRILFGEKNNKFFMTLRKRIMETTETIFLPWWRILAEQITQASWLIHFENLKTVVVPSIYQEQYDQDWEEQKMDVAKLFHQIVPKKIDKTTSYLELEKKSKAKIQNQTYIFLNWKISRVQYFFKKYFNGIELLPQIGNTRKIPKVQKIVLVGMNENGAAASEETRKRFHNSNFFFKTTPYESLLEAQHDRKGGTNQKDDGNLLKINLELEEFKNYSGFNKQTLTDVKNHPEVSFFDFSITNKQDQRQFALLDYFGIKKSQISNSAFSPIQGIMNDLDLRIDKLTFLLSEYFLDGFASIAGYRQNVTSSEYTSSGFSHKVTAFEPNEEFFGKIFASFKKKSILSEVDQIKLLKNDSFIFYDYIDFINNTRLNVSKHIAGLYSQKLDIIVQKMHWDILRILFLQKNLDKLIENSKIIWKEAEIAKKTLKDLRKLWKTCFSATNFGELMMKFDHALIFKLWEKLDSDLVRKIFGKTELHYLIPFLLDSGEPDNSPNFAGILNSPSPKTGELPIDMLIKKNPHYAIAIVNGKLHSIPAGSEPKMSSKSITSYSHGAAYPPQILEQQKVDLLDIPEKRILRFRVKQVANSNEIDEKYIITKIIQSGEIENIPFDLIHEGMKQFPIFDSLFNKHSENKLNLFPELPENQKVSFLEFKIDDSPCRKHEKIPSSEYFVQTFVGMLKIAGDTFRSPQGKGMVDPFPIFEMKTSELEPKFDDVVEDLIILASQIQEKIAKTEFSCKFLQLLGIIKKFFNSDVNEFYTSKAKRAIIETLKDSEMTKLRKEFLKKISENQQVLGKLLRDHQEKLSSSVALLKIFKFINDLEYFHLQMAGVLFEVGKLPLGVENDWFMSMIQFFASNSEFQFEEQQEEGKKMRKLSCFDFFSTPETHNASEISKDNDTTLESSGEGCLSVRFPEFEHKKDEITLLLNPLHKVTSSQNDTQKDNKEARLNNYIFRSIILGISKFDFAVFEKFSDMKLYTEEIGFLRNSVDAVLDEGEYWDSIAAEDSDYDSNRGPDPFLDFSNKMESALAKLCTNEKKAKRENEITSEQDLKKRKRDSEEQNNSKKRKLDKNDEKEN